MNNAPCFVKSVQSQEAFFAHYGDDKKKIVSSAQETPENLDREILYYGKKFSMMPEKILYKSTKGEVCP